MMWKTVAGDTLYVYWNGQLIYKRWLWLEQGWGVVFDLYGPPF